MDSGMEWAKAQTLNLRGRDRVGVNGKEKAVKFEEHQDLTAAKQ